MCMCASVHVFCCCCSFIIEALLPEPQCFLMYCNKQPFPGTVCVFSPPLWLCLCLPQTHTRLNTAHMRHRSYNTPLRSALTTTSTSKSQKTCLNEIFICQPWQGVTSGVTDILLHRGCYPGHSDSKRKFLIYIQIYHSFHWPGLFEPEGMRQYSYTFNLSLQSWSKDNPHAPSLPLTPPPIP